MIFGVRNDKMLEVTAQKSISYVSFGLCSNWKKSGGGCNLRRRCHTRKSACFDFYKLAPITTNLAHAVALNSRRAPTGSRVHTPGWKAQRLQERFDVRIPTKVRWEKCLFEQGERLQASIGLWLSGKWIWLRASMDCLEAEPNVACVH